MNDRNEDLLSCLTRPPTPFAFNALLKVHLNKKN